MTQFNEYAADGAATWNSSASPVGLSVNATNSTVTSGTWRLLREELS
jgi:hypothetical protein